MSIPTRPITPTAAEREPAGDRLFTRKSIAVRCTAPNGYEVTFSLEAEGGALLQAAEALMGQLQQRGYAPAAAGGTHPAPKAAKAPALEPYYNDDGDPCCPHHKKPLKEGRYGLYCPSRAEGEIANDKGYCRFSVKS
jgi:hypothetical protein